MDWGSFFIAGALFALAAAALVAEVFILSFGLLALISLSLGVASVVYAFAAGSAIGWGFCVAVPVAGFFILRWAFPAFQRTDLVPKAEISGDAGYHHHAEAIGAAIGATGILVTAARPTGRARFAGGEADVQCDGSAEAGTEIRITRIAGPVIYVTATPITSPNP